MKQARPPTITKLVSQYLAEHPSVKDCLRRGLVNYSALAREICSRYDVDKFDAALVACRRMHARTKGLESREKRVAELIRKAKLRVRTKILVAIIAKPRDFERVYRLQTEVRKEGGDFNLIEGEETITIITNEEYASDLRFAFRTNIKKMTEDLVQIALIFDQKIETTTGVVAHVYGMLADNGVNVLEEMSCWTDLMLIIEERDLPKAMKVLSFEE